jgi:predicted transcriptional regulator
LAQVVQTAAAQRKPLTASQQHSDQLILRLAAVMVRQHLVLEYRHIMAAQVVPAAAGRRIKSVIQLMAVRVYSRLNQV